MAVKFGFKFQDINRVYFDTCPVVVIAHTCTGVSNLERESAEHLKVEF